ncbi:conserved Plasmodium protein, unknown function [Plasmodium berghei]|uniref:Uncharacterized protein n=2 Tax=Plasmodium berghei TaxID=5821 RepID=A0A509ALZ2_PLABA|nr:conserved Plasmodium protein, unknown function [Plasmodium berghei ANKA]CXI62227.1 conserved Plasmodium protein, unknown function [Plasmodium berghei]SCM23698.1 conserved Plasmodium protein, unknown function [Plasmodium berghei]SCN26730.1 conserved Plasmodium protein, unknown function [Plasmodium berghei]SCO61039.1 conserved Plasmodium protein, unknown function [Plasmodium berghei]SCO63149.1 conserved Plasmodium protein, unknown function [Plasmodium berghei]|eukprot:XP_034422346.1 conserved Plasmodium protein, unknown function [Plasmodium berghei ANKA]
MNPYYSPSTPTKPSHYIFKTNANNNNSIIGNFPPIISYDAYPIYKKRVVNTPNLNVIGNINSEKFYKNKRKIDMHNSNNINLINNSINKYNTTGKNNMYKFNYIKSLPRETHISIIKNNREKYYTSKEINYHKYIPKMRNTRPIYSFNKNSSGYKSSHGRNTNINFENALENKYCKKMENNGVIDLRSVYKHGKIEKRIIKLKNINCNITNTMKTEYKAAGIFVVKKSIENSQNNVNNKINKNNINIEILLGFDPLKKNQITKEIENMPSMKKGLLNILGGKRDGNEQNPLLTSFREFSEENLYTYNMFLSYFSYYYYVMANISNQYQPENNGKEEKTKCDEIKQAKQITKNTHEHDNLYSSFLETNFLKDISNLPAQEKERIINLHINNFLIYFKEHCLNIKENHSYIYNCSYPPSYKKKLDEKKEPPNVKETEQLEEKEKNKQYEILERIHKGINILNKIKMDNKYNFKLYYENGKYNVFFYDCTFYECKNILQYINNFFWENYASLFNIIIKENLEFLTQKKIENNKDHVPYTMHQVQFSHQIDEALYTKIMNIIKKNNENISFNNSEKKNNIYDYSPNNENEEMNTDFMNDVTWVSLSSLLLFLINTKCFEDISIEIWKVYSTLYENGPIENSDIGNKNKVVMIDEEKESYISKDVVLKVQNLYKNIHNTLKKFKNANKYKELLILLFSPFNTKLNLENMNNVTNDIYKDSFRNFFEYLITSPEIWIFLFLNLVSTFPL